MITFQVLSGFFVEGFGGSVSLKDQIKPIPEEPISNPQQKRSLRFRVQSDPDDGISLTTGELLKNLDGYLNLYPRVGELEPDAMGIGALIYSESKSELWRPAKYFIEVYLPPDQFEALFIAMCQGQIPSHVDIEERGMSMQNVEDMEWNEKKSPHLPVASIQIVVPLQASGAAPASSKNPSVEAELLAVISTMNKNLMWIIALLVAGVAIALLRSP